MPKKKTGVKKNEDNIKCRAFHCLLYPDDSSHNIAISRLKEMDSVYIYHDKDVDEVDIPKKLHVHAILRFENAIYRSALAADLGIEDRFISPICKNWNHEHFHTLKDAELYLVHGAFKDRNKYQYPVTDLQGGINKKLLIHALQTIQGRELESSEKASLMYEFIRSKNMFISKFTFLDYAKKNDCFTYVSSKWYFWSDLISEHNYNYSNN